MLQPVEDRSNREAALILSALMEHPEPSWALLDHLNDLERQGRLELAADLFEAASFTFTVKVYWVFYTISNVYKELGRMEASASAALTAIRLEPESPSWHMYLNLYAYLRDVGRLTEAASILKRQLRISPENPITSKPEAELILNITGQKFLNDACSSDYTEDEIYPADAFPPLSATAIGPNFPFHLRYLLQGFERPPIKIRTYDDAQVFVQNGAVIIVDKNGVVASDISISDYPRLVFENAINQPHMSEKTAVVEVDDAIVIADRFPTANICHFLFDQFSRFRLYENIGIDIRECITIGPTITADYQRYALNSIGISKYIGTADVKRVRAKRLFVSTNCSLNFLHPAHGGAPWALDYVRRLRSASSSRKIAPKRIYVTRSDANARKIRNEIEVLKMLNAYNFVSFRASEHSFEEQIRTFSQASHVVGMHGAGLTNIVFSDDAKVLEVFHPMAGTPAYAIVSAAVGHAYAALVAQDADSAGADYNDPDLYWGEHFKFARQNTLGNRDVTVDVSLLQTWLTQNCD